MVGLYPTKLGENTNNHKLGENSNNHKLGENTNNQIRWEYSTNETIKYLQCRLIKSNNKRLRLKGKFW